MKLARFQRNGLPHIGKVEGDRIIDLSTAIPTLPASMRAVLTRLGEFKARMLAARTPDQALANVDLLAPIDDAQKFLAIGMNYQEHAMEAAAAGVPIPTSQLWFNKQVSCITGPYSDVVLPKVSEKVDYEAELGVVIGTRCRHVTRAAANAVIAGYVVCNDVSARDWQMRSPTFTLGKSFDTHGPIGPWITTADEIADPHALELLLHVNGQQRQRSSTGDMIYDIPAQIEYLSTVMTLEPGDILATGTPSGVGMASGVFLKHGDIVRVEVAGLGVIENRFVGEG